MEVVFEIEKKNLQKVKNVLLKDDTVSRASVLFKEAKTFGFDKDVYYCYVSGLEEACEKAKELMKDLGKVSSKKTKEQVVQKIKQEEESAMTGFGDIFA